ncbi:MAG: AMP-binding protein, partial [Polyangiaceae bacterium]
MANSEKKAATSGARFETMNDIFKSSIEKFGDRDLFGTKKDGTWHWTKYKEFGGMVDSFRGALADLGVKRGDIVAIISDNRVEWAVTAYASFGLAAALVPMYEAMLEKDWEFIAKDCGAKILVVAKKDILEKTKKFFDSVPTLKHIICLDDVDDTEG